MVKRTVIGRSGEEKIVDLLKELQSRATEGSTSPAGNKVLDYDEDFYWSRLDGTEHSLREVDEGLADAQVRIDEAEDSLAQSQVRLDDAENTISTVAEDLTHVETVVIPGAVAQLEAADQAAQAELSTLGGKLFEAEQDLAALDDGVAQLGSDLEAESQARQQLAEDTQTTFAELDGKLTTAEGEITTAKQSLTQLETDLAAEAAARQQLAEDTQGTFTELDTRLGAFATDEALAPIRQALSDAQAAVQSAQDVAETANQAANAASQAALEAAGIAASKGRVIIQETEPQGEDRNAANIWIKPIPDNPETEIEEKAITYVYLEGSDEWVPTSSDELAQAAQNALDAREAAQQARQRADTAIANAAAAKAAADAAEATAQHAQQTADGKNTVTYSTVGPSGAGKADGDIWWQYDNKSNIQGQWVWKASASQWISRPFRSEVIANLDVGKLTAGSVTTPEAVIEKIWADGIAAKSITASRLYIGGGSELAVNPYFDNGGAEWRLPDAGPGSSLAAPEAAFPGHATGILMAPHTSGSAALYGPMCGPSHSPGELIPVQPGETYEIFTWIRRTEGSVENLTNVHTRAYVYERADGGTLNNSTAGSYMAASDFVPGEWTKVGGTWTVPEGFYYLTPRVTAYVRSGTEWPSDAASWHIGRYSVVKKVGAVLIEDGAVGADKINAESVAGAVGQFVEAEVGNLKATTGTVGEAVIDKLWADGIAAKSITANKLVVAGGGGELIPFPESYVGPHMTIQPDGTLLYDGIYEKANDNRVMSRSADGQYPEGLYRFEVVAENLGTEDTFATLYHYRYKGTAYSASGWRSGTEYDLPAGQKITHAAIEEIRYSPGETGFTLQTSIADPGGGRPPIKFHSIRVTRVDQVGAVLIEDGAVSADKIQAESVAGAVGQFVEAEVGNLKATKGAVGEAVIDKLWADGIAAKSLTASRVVVSGANLVPNPYFDDGAYGWHPHSAGPGSTAVSSDAAYPGHANGVVLAPYTSERSTIYGPMLNASSAYDANRISVSPGEVYTITAWVKRTAGSVPSDRIDLRVYAYDGLTYGSNANGIAGARMKASDFEPEVWTQIGGDYTVPAGKYSLTPRFTLYPDADWASDAAAWHIGHYSVIRKVGPVLIENGAITTDKLAAGAVTTDKLLAGAVTAAKIDSTSIGTELITAGTLRTAATGERLELNSQGVVLFGADAEDGERVRLGPAGDNLLTIGTSTISDTNVSAESGNYDTLTVGGEDILEMFPPLPRGRVAQNWLTKTTDYSDSRLQKRFYVEFETEPGRQYVATVPPFYLQVLKPAGISVSYRMHVWNLDTGAVMENDVQIHSTRNSIPDMNLHTVPGAVIDLPNFSVPTLFRFVVGTVSGSGEGVRVRAANNYKAGITIDDVGPIKDNAGSYWTYGNLGDGSGGNEPPPPSKPEPTKYTKTWSYAGYGGDLRSGEVIQGQYGSYGNRSGSWTFPTAMRTALSGAKIEKFEIYLYATHWYYNAGGTASIRPTNGNYQGWTGSAFTKSGWPRSAGKWVSVPSSWFPYIVSGTYKGIGVQTGSSSLQYYGRFKATSTKFRVTYRK